TQGPQAAEPRGRWFGQGGIRAHDLCTRCVAAVECKEGCVEPATATRALPPCSRYGTHANDALENTPARCRDRRLARPGRGPRRGGVGCEGRRRRSRGRDEAERRLRDGEGGPVARPDPAPLLQGREEPQGEGAQRAGLDHDGELAAVL